MIVGIESNTTGLVMNTMDGEAEWENPATPQEIEIKDDRGIFSITAAYAIAYVVLLLILTVMVMMVRCVKKRRGFYHNNIAASTIVSGGSASTTNGTNAEASVSGSSNPGYLPDHSEGSEQTVSEGKRVTESRREFDQCDRLALDCQQGPESKLDLDQVDDKEELGQKQDQDPAHWWWEDLDCQLSSDGEGGGCVGVNDQVQLDDAGQVRSISNVSDFDVEAWVVEEVEDPTNLEVHPGEDDYFLGQQRATVTTVDDSSDRPCDIHPVLASQFPI